MYKICDVTFDDIYPIWKEDLWPGRISKFDQISLLTIRNGDLVKEMGVKKFKDSVSFYAIVYISDYVEENVKIVGVNSSVFTGLGLYRSRGLWVHHDHRGLGLSKILLQYAIVKAKQQNCHTIWSLPRENALPMYESVGFEKQSDWINDVEFGPNCIVTRPINL